MNQIEAAVAIATDYLADRLSPLQAAFRMRAMDLVSLPCWDGTKGAEGPLTAFYSAANAADRCHFIGKDVERWATTVRERKRVELMAAEERWREPVNEACRSLIEYAAISEIDLPPSLRR